MSESVSGTKRTIGTRIGLFTYVCNNYGLKVRQVLMMFLYYSPDSVSSSKHIHPLIRSCSIDLTIYSIDYITIA